MDAAKTPHAGIRHIEVEGYDLTICGGAAFDGRRVDVVADGERKTVVIAGATADERVASAFAAGLHMHEGGPVDDNVTSLPPRARVCPLLEGDGAPHVEEPWRRSEP